MEAENVLIRAYDASYNSHDEIVIQKIANDVWPQNPKIYSQQGFVMELSTGTNKNNTIIGFIMYSYVKPEIINNNAPYMSRENASMWYDIDFKKHFNYFIDSFRSKNDTNETDIKQNEKEINCEYLRCCKLNPNLQNITNWNLIESHIINITDFALIKTFQGQGFGSYLLQTLIYSFPQSTRFGLDLPSNNHIAINCLQKCQFIIQRKVQNYYGKNKTGLKMTLISSYNNNDINTFMSSINNWNKNAINNGKITKYRVRFIDFFNNKDINSIKKILYSTWPNQEEYGFDFLAHPLTIIIEQIYANNNENENIIVGFACCDWKLLNECAFCNVQNIEKHSHYNWYINVDFTENEIKRRIIGNRNDYKILLNKYNKYLNENPFDWIKLKKHFIHIKQFAIDKNHRHGGLGSLMLKYLINLFPKNTMFGLEVETQNINAIRLYKRNGFVIKREVDNYYGKNRNGYKMIMISNINMNESLIYLKKNQIVLRSKYIKHKNNLNINILTNELEEKKKDENNEYNIRQFDVYLDGIYVEKLLNDKKSWNYWPFIESQNGFIVEKICKYKNNNEIIGYIGYHKNIQIMNTNNISSIGWIKNDFNINENENENDKNINVNYITQFCIGYKYQNSEISMKLLSYFINSFPNKTIFAIEIETTNKWMVKLFIKFGFIIKRIVKQFYDTNRNAYKMILLSKKINNIHKSFQELNILKNKFICILNKENDDINYKMIKKALKRLCNKDWNKYLQNFKNEEVFDNDIYDLSEQDLKCLIDKIGPRSRIRTWIKQLKNAHIK